MTDTQILDAESAAIQAEERVIRCLERGGSFRLEAGAGAGKTFALVKSLGWLIQNRGDELLRAGKKVACVTYTNVAADEICHRVGAHESLHVSTIHAFLWTLLAPFQKTLRALLREDQLVRRKYEDQDVVKGQQVVYDISGRLRIDESRIEISHDHVVSLAVSMLRNAKFCALWVARFPVLFIDEYQDTNAAFMEAVVGSLLDLEAGVTIGLFGDHWQQIYKDGCGLVEDTRLEYIPKGSNFRSSVDIVGVLNSMRPELPQSPSSAAIEDRRAGTVGDVVVFHTNSWTVERGKGHYKDAFPLEIQDDSIQYCVNILRTRGWELRPGSFVVLRLTNRSIASSLGFAGLFQIYDADRLRQGGDPIVRFLLEKVEPASLQYAERRKAAALETLGWPVRRVRTPEDKRMVNDWLNDLERLRRTGTVFQVVAHCRRRELLSDAAELRLREIEISADFQENESRHAADWKRLSELPYSEIVSWYMYDNDRSTMWHTKHGVKGVEYEEVLVVFGGGWSQYNFPAALAAWSSVATDTKNRASFERARNLLYVTVSRAKVRLCLLFLKKLDHAALATLGKIFGDGAVRELDVK